MEGIGTGTGYLREPCLPREAPAPRGMSFLRSVRTSRGSASGPRVLIRPEAIPVRLPAGPVDLDRMLDDFVTEHERTYGHGSRLDPVELVSVRVVVRIPRSNAASYDPLPEIASRSREVGEREAYFGPGHGILATPVVTRAALLDGERPGPLLVDEYDSTVVVPPECIARLDAFGNVEVNP